ncbi:DNase I-like protein [Poronia punctata]|nr:DNase I-like protein [Poronia punctata]
MDERPVELNLITLNCWGRKYSSSYREERIAAIGRYLATAEPVPHIVALQECFEYEDYLSIRRETRFTLPFGKFYYSGAFGSGLVILSRWPIEESSMVPYSLCGWPTQLFRGGWYQGHGVACARIHYGEDEEDVVQVFNTNTHPDYEGSWDYISTAVHRLSQSWEVAKLARGAAERGHLAIVLSGFNATPFSLPYRLLTTHAPIRDAWRVLYPDSSLGGISDELERVRGRQTPTAAFNIADNGVTTGSVYNTWTWPTSEQRALRSGKRPMLIPPDTPDGDGRRIDYIFFSRGGDPHVWPTELSEILSANNTFSDVRSAPAAPPGWVVKDARVGLVARHPELGCSLSNHFSVETTLVLHTPTPPRPRRRHRRKSTSRSRSRSPTRAPSPTLADDAPIKSRTVTRNPNQRARPTPSMDSGIVTKEPPQEQQQQQKRGRHPTLRSSSFTSADTGNDIDRATAMMEQGTYLQSPTASSYRRGSRDRTAFDQQLTSLDSAPPPRLPLSAYDEIVQLIGIYARQTRRRRLLSMANSIFWCIVVLASYVAVWFLPQGKGAFGLLVVSSLGFPLGIVTLLLALFFYPTELNKLRELQWELRNARAVASGMAPETLGHQGAEGGKVW